MGLCSSATPIALPIAEFIHSTPSDPTVLNPFTGFTTLMIMLQGLEMTNDRLLLINSLRQSLVNINAHPSSKKRDRVLRRIYNLHIQNCITNATFLKKEASPVLRILHWARIESILRQAVNTCDIYIADVTASSKKLLPRSAIVEHDTP